MTPSPYSPPTMKAAFFSDGITTTHRAFSQIRSGIPLSGTPRSSESTAVASLSRLASSFVTVANAADATRPVARAAIPVLNIFIEHFLPGFLTHTTHTSGQPVFRDGRKDSLPLQRTGPVKRLTMR